MHPNVNSMMFLRTPLVQKLPRYLATLPQSVYTTGQISQLIEDYAKAVNDPFDAATEIYLQYMVDKGLIGEIVIEGEKRNMKRYLTLPDTSPFEIACSLKTNSYLSHLAAAYVHGLVPAEPHVICVSVEGSKRAAEEGDLDQEKIDEAFQRPQRQSGAKMRCGNKHFLLLTSIYAERAGIEERRRFSLTGIERTLIDLTVRPAYGGGAGNILRTYKKAISSLSIDRIIKLLEILSYKYPYHQSIGLYLSLAGYCQQKELDKLKKMGMIHSFYLEYEMIDPVYSDEWNIYFPKELVAGTLDPDLEKEPGR